MVGVKERKLHQVFLMNIENRIIAQALIAWNCLRTSQQTHTLGPARANAKPHQDYSTSPKGMSDRIGERQRRMERVRAKRSRSGQGFGQPRSKPLKRSSKNFIFKNLFTFAFKISLKTQDVCK